MNITVKAKNYACSVVLVVVLVICDQLSKLAAVTSLKGKSDIVIIKNVFTLSYLENTGAAFSLWMGKQGLLIFATAIVFLILVWKYTQIPMGRKYFVVRMCFILIISGAIGNMIDRICNRYVVDFFYFVLIDFPKFNVADIYVTVGVFIFALALFTFKEEDFNGLISFRGWKNKESL